LSKDAGEEVKLRMHETIQKAGADASGTLEPAPHNPTMRALLERYTQSHTLTERDEDGEHPLFPQSRSRGRAEQRPGHAAGGAELVLAKESIASSREQILISRVLHKIDTEKLTHVKDAFMEKDNALTSKDFVDLLLPTVRSMEGGEEQVVAALQLVHEMIGQGVKGEDESEKESEVKETAQEDELMNPAFMTEAQVEEETQKLVSWEVFAKLLLQEGVVANVVSGFNLAQVLSVIDLEKITPLQAIFEKKGNVDLESFVVIMKGQFQQVFELIALFELYEDERKIITQLVNLFDAIDVDCNGSMTWEEFTAFLVDQGMAEDVPQQYNIIRFSQSPLKDGNGHQSHCEKVIYLKGYDKVAFVEQGSKCLKLCSPDMKPYFEIRDFTQTPLCAEYIEKYNWVAVSCSDKYLSFFDADNSLKLVRRVQSKTAQRVLCWSEAAEVLFSGDHEGRILSWSLHKVKFGPFDDKTGEEKKEPTWRDFMKDAIFKRDPPMRHISVDAPREGSMTSRRKGKGKKDGWGRYDEDQGMFDSQEEWDSPMQQISMELQAEGRKKMKPKVKQRYRGENIVMQLLELPVLQQIASCGVDGNVMTWDVFTGMWKRTLRGHEMGVRCMAFATSTKVLVTGGYDYNLFVWNPYVGKSIHTIHGHSAPIVGIEVLGASSNQVVSADSEGFVKTWDLGTYQMIQSFVVDEITILRAFVSIPSSKRVIAVDREFVAFDYQNTGIADQTEEEPLIKVFYNERLKVFVSGTINAVKIWDAVTGAIKVVITHKDAEITDFCFDDRGRKLFVSDHLGKIHVYHSSTGCLVKRLTSHTKEVSGMIYCQGDKNIITVSWDRSIVVHDESSKTEVVHRRATNSHKGDITCVAYSRHLGLIATGSTDCVIAVREYLKLRILSCLLGHKTDVTALAFVEPYPLLVSADFGGNVAVWAVPTLTGKDHRHVNKVLTRFINMQSLESSASVNCLDPICTPINDHEHSFVLYAGDEDGEVRSWDLSALLLPGAEVQQCPPIPQAEWDPYKRVENDATHTAETVARKASSMEVPELQAQLEQPLVRQGISWKAHSDSLRTLKVYRNPPCVVTAGFDGMAKIWTLEGKLMSVLRAYGQSSWDFPVEATGPSVPLETQNWLLQKVHEASDDTSVDAKEALTNGYQRGDASKTSS